jgi:hypothetical protein
MRFFFEATQITDKKNKILFLFQNSRVIPLQGGKPWLADFKHEHYEAGARAIKSGLEIYKKSLKIRFIFYFSSFQRRTGLHPGGWVDPGDSDLPGNHGQKRYAFAHWLV